jgi:hypothetical protein
MPRHSSLNERFEVDGANAARDSLRAPSRHLMMPSPAGGRATQTTPLR